MTDTPMTPDRLAEIRNRDMGEVTPGPWLVADGSNGRPVVYVETLRDGRTGARVLLDADGATEADVQFIASARRSVPELLAEVDRLRVQVAELEVALADATEPDVDGAGRTYQEYHPAPAPRDLRPGAAAARRMLRPDACDSCGDIPDEWCPDCAACRQGCHGGHDNNPCTHPNAPWNTEPTP